MTSLVNRSAVHRRVVCVARELGRAGVITRVSESFYLNLDRSVDRMIRRAVESHPSAFKTLKGW